MENILEFSYKPTLILWSSNLIPRLPKRNKGTCLHKDLYESVHSSSIHNQTAENKTNIHHLMGRQTSCGTSIQWKQTYSTAIERNKILMYTHQHEWISKALCKVKRARYERKYLYYILGKIKLQEQKSAQWLPGAVGDRRD